MVQNKTKRGTKGITEGEMHAPTIYKPYFSKIKIKQLHNEQLTQDKVYKSVPVVSGVLHSSVIGPFFLSNISQIPSHLVYSSLAHNEDVHYNYYNTLAHDNAFNKIIVPVLSDVPQGSIIVPLLFLIYTNTNFMLTTLKTHETILHFCEIKTFTISQKD